MAKKSAKQGAKKKGAKKKGAGNRNATGSKASAAKRRAQVAQLVEIQQDSIRRGFDLWANSATRLAHGNFNVKEWSGEYAEVMETSFDNFSKVLKKIFGEKG